MKKIVAVAALASVLAGAAFSADISFSYKGSNYFSSSAGNLNYDSRTDCMSLGISTAVAGAVVDFDTENGAFKQDQYYGWMNFPIPTGNLELTAGVWYSRLVNRVITDAGELDDEDFELYKPGVIKGLVGKDSDNLTEKKIAMVAAYTNKDSLPGTLLAKFGLVKSTYNPDATAANTAKESGEVTDGDPSLSAGFVGEVMFTVEDTIKLNLAVKNYTKKNFSLGLFVSPLMIENLDLTVGGTFAMCNDYSKYNSANGSDLEWSNGATEFALDLRARYKLTDAVSFTTMHNLSSYANLPSGSDVAKNREYGDNTLILWDMFNVNYKMDEKITLGCTLNMVFDNLDSNHSFTGADLTTSPYIAIKATEKATVTTSLRVATTGLRTSVDGNENVNVTIPVIFSFNY
ncbi:hypothetical protein [uncultured Treponema sp.]|uniref:hypothetical protein n=1 Tax=uncultured Treponema sp. TaxID=162155 RepID=UPI0025F3BB03|nr:hypothetical protein [uncultured Treponema sp.]